MEKNQIEKIVDSAFDKAFKEIQSSMNMELYPDAFANEYSYLRVKSALKLNNEAIRVAVKVSLVEVLASEKDS